MKLTPLDIRKHEFTRRFRGYDPEEVRPFLEMLSQQWDELNEEVRHSSDRVRELEIKISHYEKVEEALQEALESAKANAQRTQTHAEERARLVIDEAELRSEQILRDAEQERFRLRQDVSKLSHRHAEVTARLRHFLMSELEILAQHEEERPIGFMKLIPAREAEALPSPETEERQTTPQPGGQEAPEGLAPLNTPEDPFETEEDPAGTTYADIYARAAQRSRQHDDDLDEPDEFDRLEEEDDHSWTLRSIVSAPEYDDEKAPTPPGSAERDQIRRIIEDLD